MRHSKASSKQPSSCIHIFLAFCGFIWLLAVYKVFFLKRDVIELVKHSHLSHDTVVAVHPDSINDQQLVQGTKFVDYVDPASSSKLQQTGPVLPGERKRIPDASEW